MNHGYPQPIGTCLWCKQPCFAPNFIAYQAGPMHPQCVQAANAQNTPKKSNFESIATAVVLLVMVLFFGTCVCVGSIDSKKTKEAKAQQEKMLAEQRTKEAAQEEATRDHVSIGKNGYLWDIDTENNAVQVFANEKAFDDYQTAASHNDAFGILEATSHGFGVARNTEVTVIDGSGWKGSSTVRILSGKFIGRKGIVYTLNVHKWQK